MHVQLPQFEGPLGLLLYLIRKDEVDIYNIPIHTITAQYLEHIKKMRELDLEVAGDFIAMAATLIHIKSRMLLPQYDENGEIIEQTDDPRKELVQKLVEYQRFQEVSKELNKRPLLGRDIWARGIREELPMDEGDIIVDEGGLFALISMYRKVVRQMSRSVHNVRAKGQSIASRILELRDRLMVGQRALMSELMHVGEESASKVLITFLTLLELTKMGFTNVFQTDTYGEIYIDTLKPIERDIIERVEEYDKKPEQAAAMAAALEGEALAAHSHVVQLTHDEIVEHEQDQTQLELSPRAEESAPAEDLASDDEILAAELEMGLESTESIDMSAIDKVLADFALESKFATEVVPHEPIVDSEASETLAPFSDLEFEEAWAKFEDDTHGVAIDAEAQVLTEAAKEEVAVIEDAEEDDKEDFAVADMNHIFKKSDEPESEI